VKEVCLCVRVWIWFGIGVLASLLLCERAEMGYYAAFCESTVSKVERVVECLYNSTDRRVDRSHFKAFHVQERCGPRSVTFMSQWKVWNIRSKHSRPLLLRGS
jgi:hypothetical protein